MLRGEAVGGHDFLTGSGRAEGIDANAGAAVPGVLRPAQRRPGLDRHADRANRTHDRFSVGGILGFEQFPAWETHDTGVDPVLGEEIRRRTSQRDLGAGRHQDDIGGTRRVPEDVTALGDIALGLATVEDRQVLPAEDQGRRPVRSDGVAPGLDCLVAVGRTDHGQVRDSPHRHHLLDGLVGRTVSADGDAVMGEHPDALVM